MKNEETKAVLNDELIDKLHNMQLDIKYYVNSNVGIAKFIGEKSGITLMEQDDINELINIRKRIKALVHKLNTKLNEEPNTPS